MGLYDDNPVQRHYRDITAMGTQIAVNWDRNITPFGKHELGLGPDDLGFHKTKKPIEHRPPRRLSFWRRPTMFDRDYVDGRYGQLHYRWAAPAQTDQRLFCLSTPARVRGRMWEALSPNSGRIDSPCAGHPGFGDSAPPPPPRNCRLCRHDGRSFSMTGRSRDRCRGLSHGSKTCC